MPAKLLIVDVSGRGELTQKSFPALLRAGIDVSVVHAPKAKTFGGAINYALRSEESDARWLWLLHDDTEVDRNCLGTLLKHVEHATSISVVGSKQLKLDSDKELISVGYTAFLGGRRHTDIKPQEFDQGQHDAREDVYAVSLNGALVSRTLWSELKGTDQSFGKFGDSLDFCRRARLAGHRVVVAPDAIVHHAQATLMDVRENSERTITPSPSVLDDEIDNSTYWQQLTSTLYFSASNRSSALLLFFVVAAIVAAPLRALYQILNKRPRRALQELVAPLWLISKAPAVLRLRQKMRRRRAVPSSVVNQLMATPREYFSAHRDRRLARSALRKRLYGPTELDKRELRAQRRKRLVGLSVLAISLIAATVFAFRDLVSVLWTNGRITGGALLPAHGGWSQLWQHWTSGWIRDGLGASAPSDPLLATLSPLMVLTVGNMQMAVNLVVLGALVASGLGAWFAAGAITRSVTARVWASLVWAAAPTLLFAVSGGRIGAIIAHSVLPWLVVAVLRSQGAHKRDSRGTLRFRHEQKQEEALEAAGVVGKRAVTQARKSLAAMGGAALLFAVIVAGAPSMLIPGIVIFGALGLFTKARSLLFVPLPALAMMGPLLLRAYINRANGGWRVLFADPGAPLAYADSATWQKLLGIPSQVAPLAAGASMWEILLSLVPYFLGGALVVGAVISLLRRGPRSAQVRGAWWISVLGLAMSVVTSSVVVASGEHEAIAGWAGTGLSLMTLGLLGACVVASDEVASRALGYSFGWRQISLVFGTLLIAVLPVLTVIAWGNDRDLALETAQEGGAPVRIITAQEHSVVPAVAQQIQESGRQARVLAIEPSGVGRVTYQLMHDDGVQLMETSTVVNISHLEGRPDDIASLVAHIARGLEQEGESAAAFQLSERGIGAVLVPISQGDEYAQLVARIDTIAGLQRITENETGTVWRVDPRGLDTALADSGADQTRDAQAQSEDLDSSDSPLVTTIVPGEPAWAASYTRDPSGALINPETVPAQRLAVHARISNEHSDSILVLAENAAPGWRATLNGERLTSTQVNGMQAFELGQVPDNAVLDVAYERSSRLPWIILQSTILLVFFVLAIPVRKREVQR